MEVIVYYFIFAVATAIVSCMYLLYPTVQEARELGIKNSFTENSKLTYFVYIGITTLIAPLMVLPILVPTMEAKFREGLSNTVYKPD